MRNTLQRTVALGAMLLATSAIGLAKTAPVANPAENHAPARQPRFKSGVMIVKLKASVVNTRGSLDFNISELDQALKQLGASNRTPLFPRAPWPDAAVAKSVASDEGFNRVYLIHYSGPFNPKYAAGIIAQQSAVEFAEPYYDFTVSATPNDPNIANQYWLDIIHAREAWDITKGDSTMAIGIVDSGVDWNHEDLHANIFLNKGETGLDAQGRDKRTNGIDDDHDGKIDDWHGWDLVGNPTSAEQASGILHPDNDPAPHSTSDAGYEGYHGTVVSGCASAVTNNGIGIAAPGYFTKILPIKIGADSMSSSLAAPYEGITAAADLGAKIINCSFGGPGDPSEKQTVQMVIDYAYNKGALVVVASGNSSSDNDTAPDYPASLDHVLSVGATTSLDSAASFSNYGLTVGVWAPGKGVFSTNIGNQYAAMDGTSFACPITSGVAALVFSVHKDWTPDQVAMQLRVTGDRVNIASPAAGPFFYRRINAYRAVSINSDLTSGSANNLPGIGVMNFTINGKTTDTIFSPDQEVSVELTMKNYLATTKNLTISAVANQVLAMTPVTVPAIGTMQTSTQVLKVKVNPSSPILYSSGSPQLMLHLTDGSYEDYIAVNIPMRIPGWNEQLNGSANQFIPISGSGLAAVNTKTAWSVSNVQTSQTTFSPFFTQVTDGENWQGLTAVQGNSDALYCIAATSELRAWAGTGPTSGQASIMRTSNGGSSWQATSVANITPFVDGVHFFDNQNGMFVGDPLGGVWGVGVTHDGGATWTTIAKPLTTGGTAEAGWNNSIASYGDNVWFGTNNGRVYHSADRGLTWTFGTTPSTNSLGVAFANANDGLAIFNKLQSGTGTEAVANSHDGGKTWKLATLPFTGATTSGITFVPGTTRAFVGTQYGVYETSDFGATWKVMAMPIINFAGFTLAAAADTIPDPSGEGTPTINWAAYGTNFYSELISLTGSLGSAPTGVPLVPSAVQASLEQNEPNPVSGLTVIRYTLATAAKTELVLYNELGERLRVLNAANEESGNHSVAFDAGNLPAGSYYYSLLANGQRLTRQMLVIH